MERQELLRKYRLYFNKVSREEKKKLLRDLFKSLNKDKRSQQETSALLIASKEGNYEAVQNILEHGIDPNEKGEIGNAPLHMAALGGHLKVVKLLLENNADLKQKNKHGATVLDAAKFSNNKKLVAFLNKQ